MNKPLVLVMTTLALTSCDALRFDDRCTALREEIAGCAGVDALPVSCAALTPSDVANLEDAFAAVGCEGIAHLLPVDGDPQAASCLLLGEGCVEAVNTLQTGMGARYPVLLVNGIDVSPLFSWSERIARVMRAAGHDAHFAVLPPYEPPHRRAHVLWMRVKEVREQTGAEKVNLLCHSLGGLDCRYLVSEGGLHWEVNATHEDIVRSVASVTMVSTAHRGTPVADIALGFVEGKDPQLAIDALATSLGSWFSQTSLEDNVDLRASLAALSEKQAPAFNDNIPDAAGVYYQSWAGFSRPYGAPADDAALAALCAPDDPTDDALHLFAGTHDHLALPLVDSYELVAEADDAEAATVPNDGLCPVESARWGRFRGCIPADHMEQLGRRNLPDANVRTGIDIAHFYADVATDLADQGY